ncbi:MAG: hypothetical protein JJ891_06965 [Rhizobiaceae bacterium]|nr:hypothetical protein [Rhizobiaceae bacterium]
MTSNIKETLPFDIESAQSKWQLGLLSMYQRLKDIHEDISMPFGWDVLFSYDGRDYWYLQVKDMNGVCNVTGEPLPWKGRKWLISPHATKGEIVQTILKATLTALEHEAREGLTYKGVAIFDPHYDLDKLVELRSAPDALQERKEMPGN